MRERDTWLNKVDSFLVKVSSMFFYPKSDPNFIQIKLIWIKIKMGLKKNLDKEFIQTFELFIPFFVFVLVDERKYFLSLFIFVLPVLPYKWKTSYRKSHNLFSFLVTSSTKMKTKNGMNSSFMKKLLKLKKTGIKYDNIKNLTPMCTIFCLENNNSM